MASRDNFWFADFDTESSPVAAWRPTIQTAISCLPLPIWFETEDDCRRWIANEIEGVPLERTLHRQDNDGQHQEAPTPTRWVSSLLPPGVSPAR